MKFYVKAWGTEKYILVPTEEIPWCAWHDAPMMSKCYCRVAQAGGFAEDCMVEKVKKVYRVVS